MPCTSRSQQQVLLEVQEPEFNITGKQNNICRTNLCSSLPWGNCRLPIWRYILLFQSSQTLSQTFLGHQGNYNLEEKNDLWKGLHVGYIALTHWFPFKTGQQKLHCLTHCRFSEYIKRNQKENIRPKGEGGGGLWYTNILFKNFAIVGIQPSPSPPKKKTKKKKLTKEGIKTFPSNQILFVKAWYSKD